MQEGMKQEEGCRPCAGFESLALEVVGERSAMCTSALSPLN
jgi:hypothetical protein